MSIFDDEYILQHPFSIQATFEGWMELMDDAVDSKEVFFSNSLINIQTLKYQNLQQEKTKYDKESMHINVKIMTSEKLYVSSEELK